MCNSCGCEGNGGKVKDLEDFRKRVGEVIENIRPSLQMDGGDIGLVDVGEDGEVKVTLKGACACCPHAAMTLKMGVEMALKEEIPEVTHVVNVAECTG